MPDQSMIERAARALYMMRHGSEPSPDALDPVWGVRWKEFVPEVRAILSGMRDLTTHEQVTFGHALASQVTTFPQTPDPVLARHTWSAMIDAALEDGR